MAQDRSKNDCDAFIVELGLPKPEARLLAARDKAKAKEEDDLTSKYSDLRDQWQKSSTDRTYQKKTAMAQERRGMAIH